MAALFHEVFGAPSHLAHQTRELHGYYLAINGKANKLKSSSLSSNLCVYGLNKFSACILAAASTHPRQTSIENAGTALLCKTEAQGQLAENVWDNDKESSSLRRGELSTTLRQKRRLNAWGSCTEQPFILLYGTRLCQKHARRR
jgi:hypothetical protein